MKPVLKYCGNHPAFFLSKGCFAFPITMGEGETTLWDLHFIWPVLYCFKIKSEHRD